MRVAIVHDWLVGGGAERVVLELHRIYPDAPIYTSYCTEEWRQKLDGKVITGYLQHWPFSRLRKFVPFLRAHWFSHLKLNKYDLVISSSGAEAKGVKVNKNTKHVNYCHAPTHYYWSRYEEYLQNPGFGVFDPLARLGLKLLVGPMRKWDYRAAQRPDIIIANSSHIQAQIKKYYNRESTVIFPPVDTARFQTNTNLARHGFLAAGRQTPYKRIDLAVAACTELKLPLTVIGNGPEHDRLVKMAGPSVTFLTSVSDEEIVKYFQSAQTLIFPGLDDFGITAIEALAAGTPVIAYKGGGALDYITPATGKFFYQQDSDTLKQALIQFDVHGFSAIEMKNVAKKFAVIEFHNKFQSLANSVIQ